MRTRPATPLSQTTGTQSISRALELLSLIASGEEDGLTLPQIVTRSRLKKPTAHRILKALTDAGLIVQDHEHRYTPGPEAYVLGLKSAHRYGLTACALPSLSRLADLSGDAALLSVQRGDYHLCLHREEGSYPLRSQVLQAGDRHLLSIGAAGIALLSHNTDHEIDAFFARNGALLAARYPQAGLSALREQVMTARAQGYAVNPGLIFPGSWAIGVALRDAQGRAFAALTLAAVESRLNTERQQELLPLLRQEAQTIEAALSGQHF
jgi:DNA-binding IclR family transcriptional regulator